MHHRVWQHSVQRRNFAVTANSQHTVFAMTGPKFECETSLSKNERVAVRPTGRSHNQM